MALRLQESKIASSGMISIIGSDNAGLKRRHHPSAHRETKPQTWCDWKLRNGVFLLVTLKRFSFTYSRERHIYVLLHSFLSTESLTNLSRSHFSCLQSSVKFMVVRLSWKDLWKLLPSLKVSELEKERFDRLFFLLFWEWNQEGGRKENAQVDEKS